MANVIDYSADTSKMPRSFSASSLRDYMTSVLR